MVDKRSLEQQFHKSDMITFAQFAVQKFWSHTPSATGSYSRLAGLLVESYSII